ncbi:hypothetical protein [Ralstonia phage RP31]|uniref:Uncharacterized protein n=2 Tax=Ripduovirus RP12 TaxID=2560700 RepID=A0A1L7N105_9CAUD|nr:hypothetical protein FDH28_gp238 [Ralstonia phage RP12]BAW19157.1 hypothetical protein [Ralstonia phage RP12]BAW19443.1 hypothetical protein [Ralstonia phage RP31]
MPLLKIAGTVEVNGFEVGIAHYMASNDGMHITIAHARMLLIDRFSEALDKLDWRSEKREELLIQTADKFDKGEYQCDGISITLEKLKSETPIQQFDEVMELNEKAMSFIVEMLSTLMDEKLEEPQFKPKPYTKDAIRTVVLSHVKHLCHYWANQPGHDRVDALSGLAFSILSMLDGSAVYIPGFKIIPMVAETKDFSEIEWCRENGHHWTHPFGEMDIGGSLHEFFHVTDEDEGDLGPLVNLNTLRVVAGLAPVEWDGSFTKADVIRMTDSARAAQQEMLNSMRRFSPDTVKF